jgi:hypothetical protein
MMLPISSSLLALIVATLLHDVLDHRIDGLRDAALDEHRIGAGGDVPQPFGDHVLREHSRGRRAVTGHVLRLGRDFLDELCAHVLVGLGQLDLLGDGHTIVGHGRAAELLVEDDVPAARAEGHLDRIRESVDALLELFASLGIEGNHLGHCGSTPWRGFGSGSGWKNLGSLDAILEHRENVGLTKDQELVALDLDLRAAVLAEQDDVALFHLGSEAIAALTEAARAHSHDLALLGLLLGGVGNDDAALAGLLGHRLDDDAVPQRTDLLLRHSGLLLIAMFLNLCRTSGA